MASSSSRRNSGLLQNKRQRVCIKTRRFNNNQENIIMHTTAHTNNGKFFKKIAILSRNAKRVRMVVCNERRKNY